MHRHWFVPSLISLLALTERERKRESFGETKGLFVAVGGKTRRKRGREGKNKKGVGALTRMTDRWRGKISI